MDVVKDNCLIRCNVTCRELSNVLKCILTEYQKSSAEMKSDCNRVFVLGMGLILINSSEPPAVPWNKVLGLKAWNTDIRNQKWAYVTLKKVLFFFKLTLYPRTETQKHYPMLFIHPYCSFSLVSCAYINGLCFGNAIDQHTLIDYKKTANCVRC